MNLTDIIALIDKAAEERRGVPAANMAALLPAAREAAATIERLQADLAALRIEHEAVCGLLTHTRKDRDDQRKRADSLALAYREAQGESDALRVQVADLQRLGASIHKAADAARRAERVDVLAYGRGLMVRYCDAHGGGGDYCRGIATMVDHIEAAAHECAASPK